MNDRAELIYQRLQARAGIVPVHGQLGLRIEEIVGRPRVGETARLGVNVFDLEVAGRPVFYSRAPVDRCPSVRMVNPLGIESVLTVLHDDPGFFHADYQVEFVGMHFWTAAVPSFGGCTLTSSFQGRP